MCFVWFVCCVCDRFDLKMICWGCLICIDFTRFPSYGRCQRVGSFDTVVRSLRGHGTQLSIISINRELAHHASLRVASRQQCAAASLPRAAFARVCRRVRCSASRRVRAGRPASLRARGAWRSRWRAAECCKSVRTFMLALHHLAMCGTWRITQLALRGCAGQRATGAC
jgi:hypothetical protein